MKGHQLCPLSPTDDMEYSKNLAVGERAGVKGRIESGK